MSKSTFPPVTPKIVSAPTSRAKAMLAHLAKIAKSIKDKPLSVTLLLVSITAWCFIPVIKASYAMLYLLADNGKKSGRADGNVYMRNGRVRRFVVPSLVQNSYTTQARALLGSLSTAWNSLAPTAQLSWNNITWLFKSDRFGISRLVKGKEAYVMLNTNLTMCGVAPITDAPPGSEGIPQITSGSCTMSQAGAQMDLAFLPTPTDTNVDHWVFATVPQSAGTSRPRKSAFRKFTKIAAGSAAPHDCTADYNAKFGNAWQVDGTYINRLIFYRIRPIDRTTGVAGVDLIVSAPILA